MNTVGFARQVYLYVPFSDISTIYRNFFVFLQPTLKQDSTALETNLGDGDVAPFLIL